ncbi:hypothetical protein C8A03DRAFT_19344, partial [Achaetomium macrosporum]
IFSSLSTLLFSFKYSDMTITRGGREFKAHRVIVCSQSPFFDKAFSDDFSNNEAATRVIDLPEDDPDVLERFLRFLYTGTYEDDVISALLAPNDSDIPTTPSQEAVDLDRLKSVIRAKFLDEFKPEPGEFVDDETGDPSFQPDQVPDGEADDYDEELDEEDSEGDSLEDYYSQEEEKG